MWKKLSILLAIGLVVFMASDVWACPTCKEGISGDDPLSQARASGYFYSILFMMAMPFVLVASFGGAAYYSIRRAQERQEAESRIADHNKAVRDSLPLL